MCVLLIPLIAYAVMHLPAFEHIAAPIQAEISGLGGAGTVIVGGLYRRRGTTAAVWTALTTGTVLGGGVRDALRLFRDLSHQRVDTADNGFVRGKK